MKLTASPLNDQQVKILTKDLHALSDLERISDHSQNIAEAIDEIQAKKIAFSEKGAAELGLLEDAVREIVSITIDSFISNDAKAALQVEPLEEVIDDMCDAIKMHHVQRLSAKECTLENGFAFNDLIPNYERVSDHCSNIALALVETMASEQEFAPHEYAGSMLSPENRYFQEYFDHFKEKYAM